MTDTTSLRLARLQDHRELLGHTLRGIEKEGLRVDEQGRLARTPHPAPLGSALTNERITTDYSESLLELITGTRQDVASLIGELEDTHRYVYANLGDELIWNQSMPADLPAEADIPIAWYGKSNTGTLKHVYRRGLAERYGKTMQCIAGVHYNFSLDDRLWQVLDLPGADDKARRSAGYIGLIRNFSRYSWLLMYLFGAAPALARDFLRGRDHPLQALDAQTLYLPYATSLRMSDLGYQNKAQSQLKLCYNDLSTFLERLHAAVTQPWEPYRQIGTQRDGEWIQLNTNILQIENEYYSSIRPKRATRRGERPMTALAERGVQYVEVRCLDIDPYAPVGISATTSRFVDAFLLFCAASESPFFPANGFCQHSADNFSVVVTEGRRPGLQLSREGTPIALADWGRELLDRIAPYAQVLDDTYGGNAYRSALAAQFEKITQPDATPSARLIDDMRSAKASFQEFTLAQSQAHARTLRATPLPAEKTRQYEEWARASAAEQAAIEAADDVDFDTYLARYMEAAQAPLVLPRV